MYLSHYQLTGEFPKPMLYILCLHHLNKNNENLQESIFRLESIVFHVRNSSSKNKKLVKIIVASQVKSSRLASQVRKMRFILKIIIYVYKERY